MSTPSSFPMVPIQRTDVFQTIIARLNETIDVGMKPGDRLPSERELAERLGVSRTSVRQALKVLESMGKVVTKVGSGTYVAKQGALNEVPLAQAFADTRVDSSFMRQLVAARAAIELAIFDDAFERLQPDHIRRLRRLLAENEQELASETHSEEEGMDLSFESLVAEFGGNAIMIRMQQQIHRLWMESWQAFGFVPAARKTLHQEHLDMLSAIEHKDKRRTLDLLYYHIHKEIG